jgi:hypothetical protein
MTRHAFLFSVCILTMFALALPILAEAPLRQVIDTEVKAVWQRQKIIPVGHCENAAFICGWRRATWADSSRFGPSLPQRDGDRLALMRKQFAASGP